MQILGIKSGESEVLLESVSSVCCSEWWDKKKKKEGKEETEMDLKLLTAIQE